MSVPGGGSSIFVTAVFGSSASIRQIREIRDQSSCFSS